MRNEQFVKRFFIALCMCFILFNCEWFNGTDTIKLKPKAFKAEISKDSIQLVDVRTPKEYTTFHIKKALNFNYFSESFKDSLNLLDKEKPVYIYCRSGKRSHKSASKFKEAGFTTIYELDGGLLNWISKGLSTTKSE